MCIAILNTSGKLSTDTLTNSWNNNEQGAGLLWNEAGHLQTYKTYKLNKLLKKYNQLRGNPDIGKIVLHFRIATSGYEKYTNLHPFLVSPDLGFVHNGIIPGLGDNRLSDTYYLNELLKSLPAGFLSCHGTRELIAGYIGGSKLVFLDSQDNHTIINEAAGHWIDGNWFSNNSHQCTLDYYYAGNTKVSRKKTGKDVATAVSNYVNGWWDEKEDNDTVNNYDYFYTYWNDASPITISRALDKVGKRISDPDIYETFEELAYYYSTNRLTQLIERINEGKEVTCYYSSSNYSIN